MALTLFLPDGSVAPNLQAVQQTLKFKTTASTVEHKLEQRPSQDVLIQSNIMKGIYELLLLFIISEPTMKIAPNLQATQQSLKFQQAKTTLDHKLERRPDAMTLASHNIIKDSGDVHPCLASDIPSKFGESAERLEPLLQSRPPIGELVDHNILKGTTNVAPALHAAQHSLQRSFSNNRLNHKLEQRPSKVQVKEQNILKKEESAISPALESICQLRLRASLQDKIEKILAMNALREEQVL